MSKQAYERKLAEIEALRQDPEHAAARLRKVFSDRSNYVVSKAAAVAAHLQLRELIPDLLAVFERYIAGPFENDKQCWAKIAIAKALKELGHTDPAVFLKGALHVQYEPVWGGREDTAGPLRAACATALVASDIDSRRLLRLLTGMLADPDPALRVDVVRAIAQLGLSESEYILRVKALVQPTDLESTGACLSALLDLEAPGAVEFVTRFLENRDAGVAIEAAVALSQSRSSEAFASLVKRWDQPMPAQLREAIVTALTASTIPESADFLRGVAETHPELKKLAVQALAANRFGRAKVGR